MKYQYIFAFSTLSLTKLKGWNITSHAPGFLATIQHLAISNNPSIRKLTPAKKKIEIPKPKIRRNPPQGEYEPSLQRGKFKSPKQDHQRGRPGLGAIHIAMQMIFRISNIQSNLFIEFHSLIIG